MPMKELNEFYEIVLQSKSALKEIYYSFSSEQKKGIVKPLVALTIKIQQSVEDLVRAFNKSSKARAVLKDKVVSISLKKWSGGIPSRVKNIIKHKKMSPTQLSQFADSLMKYLDEIHYTLQKWNNDIRGLEDIPKPPRN